MYFGCITLRFFNNSVTSVLMWYCYIANRNRRKSSFGRFERFFADNDFVESATKNDYIWILRCKSDKKPIQRDVFSIGSTY